MSNSVYLDSIILGHKVVGFLLIIIKKELSEKNLFCLLNNANQIKVPKNPKLKRK